MKTKNAAVKKTKGEVEEWPFIRWNEGRQRWMVDARTKVGGKRHFCKTKDEAEGVRSRMLMDKTNEGTAAFDDKELRSYGWTIRRAIDFALAHLRKEKNSTTIPEAIDALIKQKEADKTSERYRRDLRNRLNRLVEAMPDKKIASVSTADLDDFLNSLRVAGGTKNTFRRDIRTLWSFAEKRKWAVASEAKNTGRALGSCTSPEIFTPDEAAALLSCSSDDVLAFHAIGLFAGLRVSEIGRLDWRDIDFEGGWITVKPRPRTKTKSRRLVPILDSLRAWIEPVAHRTGEVLKSDFRKRQELARNRAGFSPKIEGEGAARKLRQWPQNAARHSFVSYRLAAIQNAAQVALECGHTEEILHQNYKELVKPKEAERFFAIRPAEGGNVIPITAAA
jgi:integrase